MPTRPVRKTVAPLATRDLPLVRVLSSSKRQLASCSRAASTSGDLTVRVSPSSPSTSHPKVAR